uniref:Uncharacterized protein n=1 Tax=Romanomermis culicivorax TaxID=13658 RepID=A0A915I0X9_ROMCU
MKVQNFTFKSDSLTCSKCSKRVICNFSTKIFSKPLRSTSDNKSDNKDRSSIIILDELLLLTYLNSRAAVELKYAFLAKQPCCCDEYSWVDSFFCSKNNKRKTPWCCITARIHQLHSRAADWPRRI